MSQKKILLVEDEALIALNEAFVLEQEGYTVLICYSAEDALNISQNEKFDLILMDIDLGRNKMSGTEAAEIILENKELPVVFLTSHSEKEMVEKVRGITRYGYVLKHSGEFVLIEAVHMAFELFESQLKLKEEITARQERERELGSLLSNLTGMAYRCCNDRNWTMKFVSEGCRKLTGYRSDEIISNNGVSFGSLIVESDKKRVWESVQEKIGRNQKYQMEYRIRTKSGEIKWVRERGNGYYSPDNELLYLEGFITEIDEPDSVFC